MLDTTVWCLELRHPDHCVNFTGYLFVLMVLILLLLSCDSSTGVNVSSSSGLSPSISGQLGSLALYTMPSEISAVPASNEVNNTPAGLMDPYAHFSIPAAIDSTDFSNAKTKVYVEEKTLKQFQMLERVLEAINQTNYENEIGNGPYKAMVVMEEENEGRNQKNLEPWVVQSDAVEENRTRYLRVRVWVANQYDADAPVIKGEFKIFTPPAKNTDGSYLDYGEWDLNVKFDETGEDDYFAASCRVGSEGFSIVKLYEKFSGFGQSGEDGYPTKTKAIMYRSALEGYGKVYFPDYESFYCPDCDQTAGIPHKTATYAYNKDYLAVYDEETGTTTFKDRNSLVPMVRRYGVYVKDTGENVLRSKSFGFPIRYTDISSGLSMHAYYGAWQGRHEIWTNDGSKIPQDTSVEREDIAPDQTPETYTVGKTYNGVLIRRTYMDAQPEDIIGIPVEIWMNKEYNLFYNADASAWEYCTQMDWTTNPPTCAATPLSFADEVGLETLIVGENNSRKHVDITGWDASGGGETRFVYEPESTDGTYPAGFYEAEEIQTEFGTTYQAIDPRIPIDTGVYPQLWVMIDGSVFVEFESILTGWVEKNVLYFDEKFWVPVFDETGDVPFNFPENQELYINMQDTSYIVVKSGGVYTVKMEIQTACNPANATTIVPDGTIFQNQWNPDNNSTYQFITDPSNPDYLMLVYETPGDDAEWDLSTTPPTPLVSPGDIAPSIWGLKAFINNQDTFFNWEYDASGQMGSFTYLMDGTSYKLLDDPIQFDPVTVKSFIEEDKDLSLRYDGWMSGLPDLYQELQNLGNVMTDAIRDKIINLPVGLELTEVTTGTSFMVKPLEVGLFLLSTTDPGNLDMTAAQAIDINTVPYYTEHGMGDMPTGTIVKYIEGIPVE